ncbi:MAG TPA: ATP-binding protein, partial [Bacteroidota bacterium]
RAEIKYDPVDLTRIACRTLRMLRETEPHRVVEERIEPGLTVWGDPHLLSQLLENLLQNAWKYSSRKGSSTIEVGRKVVNGAPAYFVKDNGAGFDMNYMGKLFRPFERLHGSEFEGIGIGLATAERIVHRHGGRIWGEGVENEGATFYFTLC